MKILGYTSALRSSLKFEKHSSNVVFEEFFLSGLVVVDPVVKDRARLNKRSRVAWMFLWRICLCVASFQSEGKPPCFNTFRTLNRSFNNKETDVSCPNNTKLNELQRNEQPNECKSRGMPEHNATEQTNGRKYRHTRRPSNKREFKQQQRQGQRQLKSDVIFNPGISQEFEFIQFVYHCQRYFTQNMYDSVKI